MDGAQPEAVVHTPDLDSEKKVTIKLIFIGLDVNRLPPPDPEGLGMRRRAAYEQANWG
jgi:hypothetical protein